MKLYRPNAEKANSLYKPPLRDSSVGFPQSAISTGDQPQETRKVSPVAGLLPVGRAGSDCGKASVKVVSIYDLESEYDLFLNKTRAIVGEALCGTKRSEQEGGLYGLVGYDANDNKNDTGGVSLKEIKKEEKNNKINNIRERKEEKENKGWQSLYVPIDQIKLSQRKGPFNSLKFIRSKEKRLYLYDSGLISENDVYAEFYYLHFRQNNSSFVVDTPNGKVVYDNLSGRWNYKRPFGYQVRKRLQGECRTITDPILISLTISRESILPLMPYHTNLDPVMFSIAHIGEWTRKFRNNLDAFIRRSGQNSEFIGWVLQFQGDKDGVNYNIGFPHIHMIYRGRWLAPMNKLCEYWPYCEPQGVDISDLKKLRKRYPRKVFSPLSVANYATRYVSKSGEAIKEGKIHKGYAWLAFTGGRIFNIRHAKKEGEIDLDRQNEKSLEKDILL